MAAIALAGCGKPAETTSTSDTFVTVNGEKVTTAELVDFLAQARTVQIQTAQGPQEAQTTAPLGMSTLRDLINQKLILQLAAEAKVMPTAEDISKELALQEERQPGFLADAEKAGISRKYVEDQVRLGLARENLMTKGITVTVAEVDDYIKKNPTQFEDPAKLEAKFIVVTDATKRSVIDGELAKGGSFETVALKYTEDPDSKTKKAKFPVEVLSALPPDLQALVNKTAEGKATDWYLSGNQWIKLYIEKKTPAKKQEIDEKKKQAVQRQLKLMKGQQTVNLGAMVTDKLRSSKIDVAPASLKFTWDKSFEQAKLNMAKQDAVTNTPASGAEGKK